ncbi:hypothetical protein KCMC57_up02170 [Kitasatospora sp. CMC57]|uniref:Uncharacterized protein n=1 Tax=Kitasatospora sp. CMC57 TaxID=3231513 RepID=A0AB33JQV3_9ACTN
MLITAEEVFGADGLADTRSSAFGAPPPEHPTVSASTPPSAPEVSALPNRFIRPSPSAVPSTPRAKHTKRFSSFPNRSATETTGQPGPVPPG